MKFPLRPGENQLSTLQRQSVFSSQPQTLGGSIQLAPGGHIRAGQSSYNVGTGFWLGLDEGVSKFSLGDSTGDNLTWDGDSLDITGTLTATTGTIGGFTISATAITATNLSLDSSGQRITLGSSNDIVILDADDATYRLWIGNATAASAPFSVTKAGLVTATNISITSGDLTSSFLNANSVDTGEIVDGAVTVDKLDVNQLSAITADLGTITAGTITLNSSGHIKSGQTAFNTGTGFFLGLDSGTAKFSIGDSSGSSLVWDGSTLTLSGDLNVNVFRVVGNTASTQLLTGIYNLSNTSGSHAIHEVSVAGSSAGNPQTLYSVSGVVQWRVGIANDDDDSLAIGTDIDAGAFYMKFIEDTSINLNLPLIAKAPESAAASIRLPHGTAPTSPVNGDMWTTTAGLFVRINGSTVGPLS